MSKIEEGQNDKQYEEDDNEVSYEENMNDEQYEEVHTILKLCTYDENNRDKDEDEKAGL